MATKHQVIALHRQHPDWGPNEIAEALDCESEYVRATFYRNQLTWTKQVRTQGVSKVRRERERCAEIVRRLVPDRSIAAAVVAEIMQGLAHG